MIELLDDPQAFARRAEIGDRRIADFEVYAFTR